MRQLLHASLLAEEDEDFTIGDRIYQSGSLGVGTTPAKPQVPFLMYKELVSQPYAAVRETSRAKARYFQFFVYDEPGSYLRIERILQIVRENVLLLVAQVSPSGVRCIDVEWQGESGDIPDPELNTILRIGTARFTVSG